MDDLTSANQEIPGQLVYDAISGGSKTVIRFGDVELSMCDFNLGLFFCLNTSRTQEFREVESKRLEKLYHSSHKHINITFFKIKGHFIKLL